jgi:hypothetical protein
MPGFVVGGFVVLHGLITTMIGIRGVTAPEAPATPIPMFNWWPGPFGRSWLLDGLNVGTGGAVAGSLVWLIAGVALVGAGLGFLGLPVLRDQWPLLAVAGASVGLVALAMYFHPIYLLAIGIDVALIMLLWERVAAPAQ